MGRSRNSYSLNLRVGDAVEVRSKREILATLDGSGKLHGLPFMPEMLQYCGKRFRVYKRADKACDTIGKTGSRRMENAVHLEGVRCDGEAHGGCQAGCLVFWKEVWLKRVQTSLSKESTDNKIESCAVINTTPSPGKTHSCTEDTLFRSTRRGTDPTSLDEEPFSCQATELSKATSYLAWWDIRQYVRDIRSGNVGLFEFGRGVLIAIFNTLIGIVRHSVFAAGHLVTARLAAHAGTNDTMSSNLLVDCDRPVSGTAGIVDHIKTALGDLLVEYPHVQGKLRKTPSAVLNLQPGEFVQVKSREEILATLDINNKNRGLLFDIEMLPYCGGTYRVLRRVEKIIDEKTGKMLKLSNNCIMLDGVVCRGCLSSNRLFCPRSIYSYWHEIWLRRVE
jgi:hypothetical protein